MPKFEPGNTIGKAGRPKGSRNRLDAHAYACVLAHVRHKRGDPPPEEYAGTNLWMALEITLKTKPYEYTRQIISMLPKQVSFEHSTITELPDDELDRMISMLRERVLEARQAQAIEVEPMKVIANGNAH